MKMVSAAKLHHAQRDITNVRPYSEALNRVFGTLLSAEGASDSVLMQRREVRRVAIVAFSSDSSLAGAFNADVVRKVKRACEQYSALPRENIDIYTIGKKVFETLSKAGYTIKENFEGLAAKPDYDAVADLAARLTAQFVAGEIDRAEVIYHHFKSAGSQVLIQEDFLPVAMPADIADTPKSVVADYILEPSKSEVLEKLLPKALRFNLYAILLDSNASEHAARMIAMQVATDNAGDLIAELTIAYNTSRQQAITAELLDMVGGQMQ
jgi:F-type H+-transporting ATPase subunit gamma